MLLLSKKNACLSLFVFFLLYSCGSNPKSPKPPTNDDKKSYAGVDKRLWPLFDNFEKEGNSRNKNINLRATNITAVIQKIQGHIGMCDTIKNHSKHIIIDIDFWNRSSDLSRELIVFHELGHCILGRGHRDDANSNHHCNSIMRSGNTPCFDNYKKATRATYLNELFAPQNLD
jgi:hypothetical protein